MGLLNVTEHDDDCFLSLLSKAQRVGGGAAGLLVPVLQGRAEVRRQTGGEGTRCGVHLPEGVKH